MFSFLANSPPRTKISHLDSISLDNGRSFAEIKSPTDRYLVVNRLPPSVSLKDVVKKVMPNKANSSLAPPLHWHRFQDETFHVVEGTAQFTIEGEQRLAQTGEVIVIPKRQIHTFCNASEEAQLVVEFVLDPASRTNDEAYFRNMWGYRNDCMRAGMQRSLFQVLLFMHRGGVVMALPGPEFISKPLGVLLNYVGGVFVGKLLLGYLDLYPAYCHANPD